jgi:hypothetical protein
MHGTTNHKFLSLVLKKLHIRWSGVNSSKGSEFDHLEYKPWVISFNSAMAVPSPIMSFTLTNEGSSAIHFGYCTFDFYFQFQNINHSNNITNIWASNPSIWHTKTLLILSQYSISTADNPCLIICWCLNCLDPKFQCPLWSNTAFYPGQREPSQHPHTSFV